MSTMFDAGGAGAGGLQVVMGTFDADGRNPRVSGRDYKESLPSKCGVQFDRYVRLLLDYNAAGGGGGGPFPPADATGPSSRRLRDLWRGRRLRLLTLPAIAGAGPQKHSCWREGAVVEWQQWCSGPLSPCTNWELTIRLDEREPTETLSKNGDNNNNPADRVYQRGDLVVIFGFQNAKQHNDRVATVHKYDTDGWW